MTGKQAVKAAIQEGVDPCLALSYWLWPPDEDERQRIAKRWAGWTVHPRPGFGRRTHKRTTNTASGERWVFD